MVGVVRASNSECACVNGVIQKYAVDVIRLISAARNKLNNDERTSAESLMPAP
jgi:hypothetical protein